MESRMRENSHVRFGERSKETRLMQIRKVRLAPTPRSGVMFLAAASCIPKWATSLGLVRFHGADIDAGCVRLCRTNCLLYGLNGGGIKWAMALTELERRALSEPYRSAYADAQQAHAAGDETRVAQIAADLRTGKLVQPGLFDFASQAQSGGASQPLVKENTL